jgi:DNA replication and repair protein RecF
MTIIRLAIKDLRNLVEVDLLPTAQANLFYGENGSGKTSVLEAISLLSMGRSFRSHKLKPLVNYQKPSLTVFGRVFKEKEGSEMTLGVSRNLEGDAVYKAGGQVVASAADLSLFLPVQVINADTFLLLDGGPKIRRQLMDWLVFHVEPGFYPAWKVIQRCLKHRNSLLRHARMDALELDTWDRELVLMTEKVHQYREASMQAFAQEVSALVAEFPQLAEIKLSYYRGWDSHKHYAQVLSEAFEQDCKQGFTQSGSHRADLRISLHGQNAADVLSRGQQKLLVCALKVAQGLVFQRMTARKPVYLVDDLPAELDSKYRLVLAGWLEKMGVQAFITGVERETLLSSWVSVSQKAPKLFHVKQGKLIEEEQN